MKNKLFEIIRAMPYDQLSKFHEAVQTDIRNRRAHGREYTSLFRLLSVSALELEIRNRTGAFGLGGGGNGGRPTIRAIDTLSANSRGGAGGSMVEFLGFGSGVYSKN